MAALGTRQLVVDNEVLHPILLGRRDRTNGLAGALCAHLDAHAIKFSVRLVINLKVACLALPPKAGNSSILYLSGSSIKAFQRRKEKSRNQMTKYPLHIPNS